jgi:hypothetical protein
MIEYAKTNAAGAVIEYPVYEHHIRNRGQLPRSYEPVFAAEPPLHNALTHQATLVKPVRNPAGELVQAWEVSVKPLEILCVDMLTELAGIRYQVETGGITLPDGTRIKTEREDQAMTNAAYSSLKNGLVPSTEWKSANGWLTVTLTDLEPVATVLARHVAASFGAERDVAEQIKQSDQAALLTLDLRGAFNAAYTSRLQALNT